MPKKDFNYLIIRNSLVMRKGSFGEDEKVDGRCWGKRWSGWPGETTGTVNQQDGEKMGYRL